MKTRPSVTPVDGIHHEALEKPQITSTDIAAYLVDDSPATALTPAENRRVLRRIDVFLMPLMFVSYALQYMDKALLSSASQYNIVQDLKLYDLSVVNGKVTIDLAKYPYCTMMFYWGFLAGALPASYMTQKFPIGKLCGASIAFWGAVTMLTATVTNYSGMLAIRFVLGFVEAIIPACFSLVVAMWFKKNEQPLLFAVWISTSGVGGIVGTSLCYAVGQMKVSLAVWKLQFLIFGGFTVLWGIVIFFTMPDNPVTAKFLTTEDRILAVERMREGQTGIENSVLKWYQVKEAFTDLKTYFYVLITFCVNLVNGAVSGFGPVIVSSFGYTSPKSVLIAGSLGAITFVTVLLAGITALYFPNQRCNIGVVSLLPVIAGSFMIWKASWASAGIPLAGFLIYGSFIVAYMMLLSHMTANTAGHTKKAVTTAVIWGVYCISIGVSPLFVRTTEITEHYPTLFIILITMLSFAIVLLVGLQCYTRLINNKKERSADMTELSTTSTAFQDMTDRENPNFRNHDSVHNKPDVLSKALLILRIEITNHPPRVAATTLFMPAKSSEYVTLKIIGVQPPGSAVDLQSVLTLYDNTPRACAVLNAGNMADFWTAWEP